MSIVKSYRKEYSTSVMGELGRIAPFPEVGVDKIAAYAIVINADPTNLEHNGMVLLVNDSPTKDPSKIRWGLPGGGVEKKDNWNIDCSAEREVREETGYKVEVNSEGFVLRGIGEFGGVRAYVWIFKTTSSTTNPQDEGTKEYTWADPKDIIQGKIPVREGVVEVIKRVFPEISRRNRLAA